MHRGLERCRGPGEYRKDCEDLEGHGKYRMAQEDADDPKKIYTRDEDDVLEDTLMGKASTF